MLVFYAEGMVPVKNLQNRTTTLAVVAGVAIVLFNVFDLPVWLDVPLRLIGLGLLLYLVWLLVSQARATAREMGQS